MYPLSSQSPPSYSSRLLFVSVAVTLTLFSGAEVISDENQPLTATNSFKTNAGLNIYRPAIPRSDFIYILRDSDFVTYINASSEVPQILDAIQGRHLVTPVDFRRNDRAEDKKNVDRELIRAEQQQLDLFRELDAILTPAQIEATWAAVAKLRGYEVFREETWIMDHLELTVAERSELAKIFSEDQLVRNEINSGFRERTDLDSTNQELIREEMRKQNERLLARQTETETMVVKLLTASQREKFRLLQESCKFDFAKLDGLSPPKRNAVDSKQTSAGLVRPPRDED